MNALTTEELVSLVAGTNVWETAPVERLGIPSIRVTDGPVGARGTRFDGPESINVPCSTSLAATWDPALVRRVGELLGREARAKGARVLLAPTVNLHRTPIGGRNFECMSEDPYLTAEQAVAYVEGVQSEGVACCIKHFVGNDTEFERNTIDSRIDERTLREKYLVPFEAAVTRAKVGSIMTAYNRLNGTFCADHTWLLDDVLRGEWGFDGLVMSDWFGLHSTIDGILAGCDLEMPGPRSIVARLVAAIEAGEIDVDAVRTCARRVLEFVERWHGFEDGAPGPETTRDDPDDVALVREAGAHGAVLLQNRSDADGAAVLPLASSGLGRVAIIGPNAFHGQVLGGGSAHVNPTSISRPLDALTAFVEAAGGTVTSAPGCHIHKRLPSLSSRLRTPLRGAFFLHPDELDDPSAAPARSLENVSPHAMWNENPADPEVARHEFGARLSTTFTPDVSGPWQLSLATVGAGRLLVDGTVLIDTGDAPVGGSFFGLGTDDVVGTIDLVAGRLRGGGRAPASGERGRHEWPPARWVPAGPRRPHGRGDRRRRQQRRRHRRRRHQSRLGERGLGSHLDRAPRPSGRTDPQGRRRQCAHRRRRQRWLTGCDAVDRRGRRRARVLVPGPGDGQLTRRPPQRGGRAAGPVAGDVPASHGGHAGLRASPGPQRCRRVPGTSAVRVFVVRDGRTSHRIPVRFRARLRRDRADRCLGLVSPRSHRGTRESQWPRRRRGGAGLRRGPGRGGWRSAGRTRRRRTGVTPRRVRPGRDSRGPLRHCDGPSRRQRLSVVGRDGGWMAPERRPSPALRGSPRRGPRRRTRRPRPGPEA
ncbi:MAG: glycoside hydrolase family 3 N-terminal domain-containing protein [Ilumatobacteraceae bacterium]